MTETKINRLESLKEDKRKVYLRAAAKVFQEKGFNNTTVKDITDAAGTSVGNFYHYFETKEQIFQMLVEDFHKFLFTQFHELDKHEIPPLSVIKKVMQDLLVHLKDQKEIVFIYLEQIGGINKEFQELRDKIQDQYMEELEKIIARGHKITHITDQNPRIVAIGWITTFLETYHYWGRKNFDMKVEDVVNGLVNFLLYGTGTTTRIYPPKRPGEKKKVKDATNEN
jgi:AcrR family transcriptional regulator